MSNEKITILQEEENKVRELEVLMGYDGEDRVVDSEEMRKEIEERNKKGTPSFSSGVKQLDDLVGGGFAPGNLTTIVGMTKSGKSLLGRTLCSNFVANGLNSLYFSYEESEEELLEKFPKPYPLFYLPRKLSSQGTDWINLKIGEAKAKFDVKCVFIDNLDFLLSKNIYLKSGNMSDLIRFIMVDLKNMARKWEVSIFLQAHTTQEGTRKGVELGDIKGSASIAQTSDFVLAIKRLVKQSDNLPGLYSQIRMLANRKTGKCLAIKMRFNNDKLEEEYDEVDTK